MFEIDNKIMKNDKNDKLQFYKLFFGTVKIFFFFFVSEKKVCAKCVMRFFQNDKSIFFGDGLFLLHNSHSFFNVNFSFIVNVSSSKLLKNAKIHETFF